MPYCTNCGQEINRTATFCTECGFRLAAFGYKTNEGKRGAGCPLCGENDKLRWSTKSQKWICDNCGNYFSIPSELTQLRVTSYKYHEKKRYTKRKWPFRPHYKSPYRALLFRLKRFYRRKRKPHYYRSTITYRNIPLIKCFIISIASLAAILFGLVRIATWINWLSLPWIEGWGEIFMWWVIPFELVFLFFGIIGILWILTEAGFRRGFSILVAIIVICGIAVMVVAPAIPNILFWKGEDGERMEELIEPDIASVVVGADGHRIWLHNNPEARNPTWEELWAFLREDRTDQHIYSYDSFVCADFAEMLHNNAEASGIRAAYITIRVDPSSYYALSGGHALNAFHTTDRGLVYIDSTAPINNIGNADRIVNVKVGDIEVIQW